MRRQRRHIEEPENHERWLVSYADFITLLFAFFVVMYAISSINEGKYRVLSDSLVNAFKTAPRSPDPIQIGRATPSAVAPSLGPAQRRDERSARQLEQQTESMNDVARDILRVMAPLVKEGQVKITQSARGVTVEINASVLFSPGQAALQGESAHALAAVAQVLAPIQNQIQIEGHTDNIPIANAAYPSNWELSSARASSVARLFVDNGIAASRLVAMGYAENRPIESNDTPEGRARNRRVSILILSDLPESGSLLPLANGLS